jgi:hypothetical protein
MADKLARTHGELVDGHRSAVRLAVIFLRHLGSASEVVLATRCETASQAERWWKKEKRSKRAGKVATTFGKCLQRESKRPERSNGSSLDAANNHDLYLVLHIRNR